ncbi:5'-methylthioadenosine/S-adenosylhomocysteine nucleosidase [Brachybacterium huguangmaarense]
MSTPSAPGPVVVLAAMAEEAAPLVARLEGARESLAPFPGAARPVAVASGTLAGREVHVVTCGIGIAAASAATTWAALALAPAAIVSAGSAGGLADDVEVGTLIVSDTARYSIADATAFGYAPGQVPGQPEEFAADRALADAAERAARGAVAGSGSASIENPDPTPGVRRGLMLSGDAFVTAPLAEPMRARFPGALSADMETAAIAQTCSALGVPFVALRAVSDLCGPRADQQFHLEIDVVAETSAAAVARLIAHL